MNINLNSRVTVTLTPVGVKIVRIANLEYRKKMIRLGIEVSDAYKVDGDQLTDTFWEIIQLFSPYCSIGMEAPFTDLRLNNVKHSPMNPLQTFCQNLPGGFITAIDLPKLVELDRLFPVLVRCGSCRFQCPAQDADQIMSALIASGDYVRDVSLVNGWERLASVWIVPETPVAPKV